MHSLSRREFLRASVLTTAATVAAACAVPAPTPVPPEAPPENATTVAPEPVSKYTEAPMLSDMVKAGTLPPVDERVPENPFVIEGLDGIGKFGGTWRRTHKGTGVRLNYQNGRGLLNYNHEMTLHAYLAESWSVSEDGTEYTFALRKGTRWSDGAPMTAEDYRYYFEDEILNEALTPAVPERFASVIEGERVPATFVAPDDYTVSYVFKETKGLFYAETVIVRDAPASPAHYMKPFHAEYGDEAAIDGLVASNESWDDWTQMYFDMNSYLLNVERPIFFPWVPKTERAAEFYTAERNPYFWEVDTAGNQLPYFDRTTSRSYQASDVMTMWAVNGEIDLQKMGYDSYTVFKENEEKGDYWTGLVEYPVTWCSHFNLTSKDERLRWLFNQRDFRIAMSVCVDRDEMRELLYDGFCTNQQYVPSKASPWYYEKLANAYIEYDPDQANELLDGLGLTERDAEGYRLWNDGSAERVSFVDTMYFSDTAPAIDLMLVDYYKAVGVQMVYRGVARDLSKQMCLANEKDMEVHDSGRALVPQAQITWTKHLGQNERPWCCAWSLWYADSEDPNAEEPPEGHWMWDIWAAWEELQKTVGEENQKAVFWKILDIWAEELPCVGYIGNTPLPVVVKNGLKGWRDGIPYDCCATCYEYIIDDATWYWDEPEKHA